MTTETTYRHARTNFAARIGLSAAVASLADRFGGDLTIRHHATKGTTSIVLTKQDLRARIDISIDAPENQTRFHVFWSNERGNAHSDHPVETLLRSLLGTQDVVTVLKGAIVQDGDDHWSLRNAYSSSEDALELVAKMENVLTTYDALLTAMQRPGDTDESGEASETEGVNVAEAAEETSS